MNTENKIESQFTSEEEKKELVRLLTLVCRLLRPAIDNMGKEKVVKLYIDKMKSNLGELAPEDIELVTSSLEKAIDEELLKESITEGEKLAMSLETVLNHFFGNGVKVSATVAPIDDIAQKN